MSATGLRLRYFITILTVLLIVAVTSGLVYAISLRRERIALIDEQVRETAAALVDSELGDLRKIDFEKADEIISEELGESRIGKFIVIRNAQGQIIFESTSAKLLPVADLPVSQRRFEVRKNGVVMRGLNLQLPRFPDRTLQVGLLVREELIEPSIFSSASLQFFWTIIGLGFLASFVLTSFLLKPIVRLNAFVASVNRESLMVLPEVPKDLLFSDKQLIKDEFQDLLQGLRQLIAKVNRGYKVTRLWSLQMAHELKSPLARIQVAIEQLRQQSSQAKELDVIEIETRRVGNIVSAFLAWAEVEGQPGYQRLFALDVAALARTEVERFNSERLELIDQLRQPLFAFAERMHLELAIQNLIANALFYSPPESKVVVELEDFELRVRDAGSGIPPEVISRLGDPFNRGSTGRGHGLGLAWVVSVCRRYSWELKIESSRTDNLVKIRFPKFEAQA